MIHRHSLTFLFALIFVPSAFAQTQAEVISSINALKRDTTYLYAEATTSNLDTALYNAKSILEMKVRDWVRQHHSDERIEVCIAKAKEHSFDIHTLRGNLQRAFVYVCKSDILPIANRNEVMVFDVAREAAEEGMTTPTEIISEDTQVPEQGKEQASAITLTTEENDMLTIENLKQLNEFVSNLKQQKRINGYGKYTTMPKDADCHIFICNEQGKVVARLRHQSDGKVFNLSTKKIDSVESYGRGAIWFQLKQ